jgi:hypothetical protein
VKANGTMPKTNPNQQQIDKLYDRLVDLAMIWRSKEFHGEPGQDKVVTDYQATIRELELLGWNQIIYSEEMLPPEIMPENYTIFGYRSRNDET